MAKISKKNKVNNLYTVVFLKPNNSLFFAFNIVRGTARLTRFTPVVRLRMTTRDQLRRHVITAMTSDCFRVRVP